MRAKSNAIVAAIMLCPIMLCLLGIAGAQAQQTPINIAIKGGETLDLGPIYYVSTQTCRSLAIAKPEVEILEGPPDMTVTIREGEVVPRAQGCTKKIHGGTLLLTAPKEIEDSGSARLLIRITYKTRDGEQKRSVTFNLTLVP